MGDEPDAPSGQAPSPESVARRFGAPRDAAVPRMETVRVTKPDLQRRAVMERTRARLVFAAGGFAVLFAALALKLADATVLEPIQPKREPAPARIATPATPPGVTLATATGLSPDLMPRAQRAMITDRNGEILAVSVPIAAVYANPREMVDQAEAAHKLRSVLPGLDEAELRQRLSGDKTFVYISRHVTARQQLAINRLGIPGVYFEASERRRYPLGRAASHVLGGVDAERHGFAGVEKFFEQRLREDPEPLRLSIDVHVQAVVRDELTQAKEAFHAIGACGIVMDVRTGEVLAMVNLPDYDANDLGRTDPEALRNRAVGGMYEPGSTFKLQTAAMALDYGTAQPWNMFDAANPIKIGRFTITDFEGKHRMLSLPEVLVYSSNLGAAHIAMTVGAERQRAWLGHMGMFSRVGIELPEAGMPLAPPVANWKEAATMTIGFGHGIAVSPLHVVRGTAAIANGGYVLRPTILARPADAQPPTADRIMSQATSDLMRKLMRLVVTDGYGKPAEVAGYFVGGKTGTAEKVGGGVYRKHANVSAFMSVFPMNAPRYAVYMMLDEPQANASTHGYATAGWVSAPAAGKVIARIGPILGLMPQTDAAAATIQAALAYPLQPGRAAAAKTVPAATTAPQAIAPAPANPPPLRPKTPLPAAAPAPTVPATVSPPVTARDLRHEVMWVAPRLKDPAFAAR